MTGPQIVQFAAAVNKAFTVDEFTSVVRRLGREVTDYASPNATVRLQIEQVVAAANTGGSWIAQLVVAVVEARPDSQLVKAFLRDNPDWDPARVPLLAHASDTLRVFGGKAFIGRQALRTYLKAMSSDTGRKLLLITSDHRKVGKTYSRELINFLSGRAQPSGLVYLDLDKDDYTPERLATELARGLGIKPDTAPSDGQQQAVRWNQELVSWLVPTGPNLSSTVWWIVLDGFRQKVLSEATQDLISQLAQRIQMREQLRLILLNYTYRLPFVVDAFAFKDKVLPIARTDVEMFLSRVHQLKHGGKPSDALLAEYVDGVYERLTQYLEEYPEEAEGHLLLNKAVSEATDLIEDAG